MKRSAVLLALLAAPALAHHVEPLPALDFVPPAVGTYTLHRIMAAPDGNVVGVDGRAHRLSRFTRGRVTLLGFIYTTCIDPDGCPLAYRVFDVLRDSIVAAPPTPRRGCGSSRCRSIPPVTRPTSCAGTPAVASEPTGGLEWYFLTTRSTRDLLPLVEGFGQDVGASPSIARPARADGSFCTCSRCS